MDLFIRLISWDSLFKRNMATKRPQIDNANVVKTWALSKI